MSHLDKIVESCQYLLDSYPEAQATKDYLDLRLSQESRTRFQFGYFPNTDNLRVLTDLVGEDLLLEEELFYHRSIEDSLFPRKIKVCYFEHYPLLMPFRDPYGTIVGLVCRTLLPEAEQKRLQIPKYKNTKNFNKGNYLFGLHENKQHILDKNSVYVVEGQFDMIKATEIGFNNIVALGTNMMTLYQFSVISRYTSNIFLLLDNDEGGNKGRMNAMKNFGHLANIRDFYIPENYKDIAEYITKEQIGSYEELSFIVKG